MPENEAIDEQLVAAAVEPLPPATHDAAAVALREWMGPWVAAEDALAARKQAAEELARTAAGFERRRKWQRRLALAIPLLALAVALAPPSWQEVRLMLAAKHLKLPFEPLADEEANRILCEHVARRVPPEKRAMLFEGSADESAAARWRRLQGDSPETTGDLWMRGLETAGSAVRPEIGGLKDSGARAEEALDLLRQATTAPHLENRLRQYRDERLKLLPPAPQWADRIAASRYDEVWLARDTQPEEFAAWSLIRDGVAEAAGTGDRARAAELARLWLAVRKTGIENLSSREELNGHCQMALLFHKTALEEPLIRMDLFREMSAVSASMSLVYLVPHEIQQGSSWRNREAPSRFARETSIDWQDPLSTPARDYQPGRHAEWLMHEWLSLHFALALGAAGFLLMILPQVLDRKSGNLPARLLPLIRPADHLIHTVVAIGLPWALYGIATRWHEIGLRDKRTFHWMGELESIPLLQAAVLLMIPLGALVLAEGTLRRRLKALGIPAGGIQLGGFPLLIVAASICLMVAGTPLRRSWGGAPLIGATVGIALAVGFLWLLMQTVRQWIRPAGDLTGAIFTQAAALPVAVALLLGTLALPAMKFAERQLVARDSFERGPAGHDGHPTAAEQEFVTHTRDQLVKTIGGAEERLNRKLD
jgi:hypothetical protein